MELAMLADISCSDASLCHYFSKNCPLWLIDAYSGFVLYLFVITTED